MKRPTLRECLLAACDVAGVTPKDVAGKGRHGRTILARELASALAREFTLFSYPEIARALKVPNHSTIVTAHLRVIEDPDGMSRYGGDVHRVDSTFPATRREALERARAALKLRVEAPQDDQEVA